MLRSRFHHLSLLLALLSATHIPLGAHALEYEHHHHTQADPVVSTACGAVEGKWRAMSNGSLPQVAAFLGIPYGAPPVRWGVPSRAACWNGTLQAKKEPPPCVQWYGLASTNDAHRTDGTERRGRHGGQDHRASLGASENCLHLNVYAPEGAHDLPVFVWLYGGNNCFGSTTSYGDFPRILDADHKAVIVAPNFRLNALGFLALRELSAADPRGSSGNYGILDIQLALQWVQANIAAFGGNPNKVTVIGQSSGGTNILALLASPASRGLLHAAISLSGSPNITMDLSTAEQQGRALVANSMCKDSSSADVLACLRALSPGAIMAATPANWQFGATFPEHPQGDSWGGLVVVDGVTVAMPVMDALQSGLVDVPVILQALQGELDLLARPAVQKWTTAQVDAFFTKHFAPWGPFTGVTISSLYRPYRTPTPSYPYYAAEADMGIVCGTVALGNAAARGFRSNVYVSVVNQRPSHGVPTIPGTAPSLFPFHLFDYMAGFRVWDFFSRFGFASFDPAPSDLALGDLLRDAWFGLATNGTMPPHISWQPVGAAPAFPAHYYVFNMSVGGASLLDWKHDTCSALEKMGFDQRFWWVN